MKFLKALNELLVPYRLRQERRHATEFVAYVSDGGAQKSADIDDISSTGVYLLTDERWLPGSSVQLTLQRKGTYEEDSQHRVTLKSRVVRWGKNGVGLAFTLPAEIDFDLWEDALRLAANHASTEDILSSLRMAKSLEFLSRLCPDATQDTNRLVRTGLGHMRIANAVQIALGAESMLASEPDGNKMRANRETLLRIIADGAWADEDSIQQLWTGLLVTSCAVELEGQLGPDLAERFSQLAPVHLRIFKAACIQAQKATCSDGQVISQPLTFEVRELQQVAGVQNLASVERDVFHLADLGLLEENVRSRSLLPPDVINVTPSSLGLRLYALCNGHRGALRDFYGLNG